VNPPGNLRRRGQIYVAAAAVAWSIAGVMQRGLTVDIATQAAGRSLFAFLALCGVCIFEARRTNQSIGTFVRAIGWAGVAMAVCLGGASGAFITALNYTSVASVLFIQSLAPIVAVVVSHLFLGERASRATWVALAIALVGVGVMVGGPKLGSPLGLLFAVIMAVLFGLSIVLTRYARDVSMAPGSALSQLLVFVVAVPFAHPSTIESPDLWRMIVMGVFQMGLGQLCFVVGARLISAGETGLITLVEVLLGPLWVWLFYRENPGAATLIGGVILLGAVVYHATHSEAPVAPTSSAVGAASP
jgi:drug/metabolite transporter (DMT)-like permease